MATSVASAVDPLARGRSHSRSISPAASALTDHDGDSIIEDAPAHLSTMASPHRGAAPPAAPAPTADDLKPSGPICSFGPRLAYTYFAQPAPRAELLNALTPGVPAAATSLAASPEGAAAAAAVAEEGVHWFSVDDQLVYLSFYQDYGPLNVGCL